MTNRLRTLIATSLIALIPTVPAHAEDGIWKVGTSYVIRFEKLDLSRAVDRQVLLGQVERTVEKVCRGQRPETKRAACRTETLRIVQASADPSLRGAIDMARFERDGVQQAKR